MEEKATKKYTYSRYSEILLIVSGFVTTYKWGLDSMISETIEEPSLMGVIVLIFLLIVNVLGGILFNFVVLFPVAFVADWLADRNPNSNIRRWSYDDYFRSEYTIALIALFAVISFLLKEPLLFWLF